MTNGTDEGRSIERVETFHVSHTLNPRTGPSIALSSTHAYILVKVTDSDGRAGWGETYLVPGIPAILQAVAPVVINRSATGSRAGPGYRWAAEHTYAASALTIAVEDLRARRSAVGGGVVRRPRPDKSLCPLAATSG
jgi:L-alanine-DL-glutamate epimerase-like enolase superfamily enzyme